MKQKIPQNEEWLHTPEVKVKLERADAWMRNNPPKETDLVNFERQIKEHHRATAQIVLHLFLDFEFVPIGSHRPIMNIIGRLGWMPYDLGGDYVYSRSDSTIRDALDLLQIIKAELPWFNKALDAAWASEVLKTIDLKEVLEPGDGE